MPKKYLKLDCGCINWQSMYTKLPQLTEGAIMQETKIDNIKMTGQNGYAMNFLLIMKLMIQVILSILSMS